MIIPVNPQAIFTKARDSNFDCEALSFFNCTFILKPRFHILMLNAVSLPLVLRKMPEQCNVVITNA